MKFLVTDIEFDFDDGNDGESYSLTYDEQIEIRDQNLGVWEADNEDDMIDEITAASGWLIKNIYYDIRRMAELEGFGNLPKDNEGTETTIFECLDNCITQLLEEQRTK